MRVKEKGFANPSSWGKSENRRISSGTLTQADCLGEVWRTIHCRPGGRRTFTRPKSVLQTGGPPALVSKSAAPARTGGEAIGCAPCAFESGGFLPLALPGGAYSGPLSISFSHFILFRLGRRDLSPSGRKFATVDIRPLLQRRCSLFRCIPAFATITYAFNHSNRRGFHPRIRLAFALEAPLNFVA